jgi:hypothetical protein
MQYHCSKCHTVIDAEAEPERCPTCKAEVGFERSGEVPLAMKLFGGVVGAAIVASAVGGLVTRMMG